MRPASSPPLQWQSDQKGTEHMAQPDPDPDPDQTASEVPLAADGDSSTKDLPTIDDGSPGPMEDMGYNENIPGNAVSTLTPAKSQLVQECPALVYMAKDSHYDTDSDDDSPEPDGDELPTLEKLQSAQDCPTPVYIAKACQDTIESKES